MMLFPALFLLNGAFTGKCSLKRHTDSHAVNILAHSWNWRSGTAVSCTFPVYLSQSFGMFHGLFWYKPLRVDERNEANQLKLHSLRGGVQTGRETELYQGLFHMW